MSPPPGDIVETAVAAEGIRTLVAPLQAANLVGAYSSSIRAS